MLPLGELCQNWFVRSELIFSLILEFYWKGNRRKFGGKNDKHSESKLIFFNGRWVEHHQRVALAKMRLQIPPHLCAKGHLPPPSCPCPTSFCSAPGNSMSCHQLWRMHDCMAQWDHLSPGWELQCERPRQQVRDMEKALKIQLIFILSMLNSISIFLLFLLESRINLQE